MGLLIRKKATPAGFETGPRFDRNPRRCAGFHRKHSAGLGPMPFG